jgi:class 3 adenylate cyclase/predicted ATPase
MAKSGNPPPSLVPYVPRLLLEWLADTPEATWRELDGSVLFADVSGFTAMSERLAKRGKVGAEEVTDVISSVCARLLSVAYGNGGSLLKFGGDALLLFFAGDGHEARATRAAVGMRTGLREIGRIETSRGRATLRMSAGVHSGHFLFFLVGRSHRELLVTGPAVSRTVEMEGAAEAGEVVISPETAAALPRSALGPEKGAGILLRRAPPGLELGFPADESGSGIDDVLECIPVALREHLLAGVPEPEHRPVTIAFVHFEGVDELVTREGPSALGAALEELVRLIQRAADAHGVTFLGTDVDRDGGKIILAAGAPQATRDDGQRVLLAVRAIADGRPPIPVRIGVNRGHVFAGEVGPPYRRTYTVMGDAVNLAARVMARAELGHVLAARSVIEASAAVFRTIALDPFFVKGKRQPVEAFAVGSAIGVKDAAAAATPLIGRERELAALLEALEAARLGSGRVVEIVASPGLGGSRLVEEVRSRAADARVLTAVCEEYAASTPYFGAAQLLRNALELEHDDPAEVVSARLSERVAVVAPELAPWLPLLGVPLGLHLRETPETEQLEDQFRRARLEESVDVLLARLVPGLALIRVESAHWLDEASGGVLRHLARGIEGRPWLVVLGHRDAPGPLLDVDPPPLVLELAGLAPAAAYELAAAATSDRPLPPHVLQDVVERSEGNPMFLLELIEAADRERHGEALPTSLEALLAAQIDRLASRDRTVLRYASVLGVAFPAELLEACLSGGEYELRPATWRRLDALLLKERGGGVRFRHGLVRDAAYEGLSYRRRRELHARVGEVIEAAAGEEADEQAELLSLHFFHAHEFDQAFAYSRIAADRAKTLYANVEAARFCVRAIEAARRISGVVDETIAELYESLGDVRERIGLYPEAASAYTAARRLRAGDRVAVAGLMLKEAWIPERSGRYTQALRWVTRGLKLLEGVEGTAAGVQRAHLLGFYAAARQQQGRAREALRWSGRAIAEAESSGAIDALAHAYYTLDCAYAELGELEKATHLPRALAIAEELGDRAREALVYNALGAFAYWDGRWRDALELYAKAREARLATGDPVMAADGTYNIAEILIDQGRTEEAEPLLREALPVWRAAQYRASLALALVQLGRVASRAGDHDEAMRLFSDARAELADVGAQTLVIETDARTAECLLFQGANREAIELATDALARAERTAAVSVHVPLLQRIRGLALARLGATDEASDALDMSLLIARARGADHEIALTLDALTALHRVTGEDHDEALDEERDAILERLGVIAVPSFLWPVAAGAG